MTRFNNQSKQFDIVDLNKDYLYPIETSNYKNKMYIYFDETEIKDYEKASEAELRSFKKILESPRFARQQGDDGIKRISGNVPSCEIIINGIKLKTQLKYELKIKGTNKEGRITLYELNEKSSKGATILVANQYFSKGLHKAKDSNKTYYASFFYKKPAIVDQLNLTGKISKITP